MTTDLNVFLKQKCNVMEKIEVTTGKPKNSLKDLDHSRDKALSSFRSLKKKLSKNCDSRSDHNKFMNEYLSLGHMREVCEERQSSSDGFFMPHHAVLESSSLTTKCRIVFNASEPTDSVGLDSAQEILECQRELTQILSMAGFQLRKWLCNAPKLLKNLKFDDKLEAGVLQIGQNEQNETLGIFWNSNNDLICYSIGEFTIPKN
ncbi:hypothetical protein JTB14_002149 [Gonioctena quinquepunctata]|nr:hypothetical protein JTB14_002149 [Gonioctena quinquepunctata]